SCSVSTRLLILSVLLLFSHVSLSFVLFFFYCYGALRPLHSFPTRRSSDLTGETFEGAYASLCHVLLPCLEGLTVFDTAQLHQRMDRTLRGNPSIKAAVDIAVHDALATAVDLPLFRVLGGQAHSELTQPYVIGITSPEAAADEASAAVAAGYTEIKLKVGNDDGDDIRRIRSLHRAVN